MYFSPNSPQWVTRYINYSMSSKLTWTLWLFMCLIQSSAIVFSRTRVSMHSGLCNCITCLDPCGQHHNQNRTITTKTSPLCYPFITTYMSPTPSLTWQSPIRSHRLSFHCFENVMSVESYCMWPSETGFSTGHNSLEIYPSCSVY